MGTGAAGRTVWRMRDKSSTSAFFCWNGHDGTCRSSSLTFPLAPGRLFVPTEDWREDVVTEWALNECSSGDEGVFMI